MVTRLPFDADWQTTVFGKLGGLKQVLEVYILRTSPRVNQVLYGLTARKYVLRVRPGGARRF